MRKPKISFWKHLMFSEARPLVERGRRQVLSDPDFMEIPDEQVPNDLTEFAKKLDFSSGDRLIWSNLRALGWKYKRGMLLYIAGASLALTGPILVNNFVKLLSQAGPHDSVLDLSIWGLALAISSIFQGLLMQHYFYDILGCEQISTRALNKKVYLQSLRLSLHSRSQTPVGDIVNHMSSDSDGVSEFVFVSSDLIWCVFIIVGASGLLLYFLGWTALAALFLFAILVPLSKKMAGRFTDLGDEMMRWRDQRVSLMSQILSAIRLVKYFVWEKSVYDEVEAIRRKELKARQRVAQTEVMANAAYTSVSSIVLFITLGIHALRGQVLDVALVFTCISLFGLIEEPLGRMSNLLSRYTSSFVGSRRLVEFLRKSGKPASPNEFVKFNHEPVGLQVQNLSVTYEGSENIILKDLNFILAAGQSLAIVGPVGCGKSTLLLTLLGELAPRTGDYRIWNSKSDDIGPIQAYCPQEAYIINGSLSENLTFGVLSSEDEIHRALKLTALEQDMKLFPAGLQTEIGEKGVNLSGGQKQRVALARAVLAKPGLVFLDDPLSAVDVETEKHLVRDLIFGEWKKVTRIVATHRMEALPFFDRIIFIDDGLIKASGNFNEVLKEPSFMDFYSAHHHIQDAEKSVTANFIAETKEDSQGRITEDEERETGAVKSTVYLDYIRSLGGVGPFRNMNLVLLLFGSAMVVLMPLTQKAWLSMISKYPNPLFSVGIYGILGLCTLAIGLSNGLFWLHRGVEAGRQMHMAMLKSVLGAPIRFFDSTPVGRILQRFSRDIESVDVYLQWTFDSAIHCFFQILVTLFLIAVVLPTTLIVMGPMLILYYFLQRDYRRPAREIKRLDSMARSPRYAHFKETLMGLNVIRGFRREDWFIANFQSRLLKSQKTFYNHYILNRWFSVRIPFLGGAIAGATMIFISYAVVNGILSAGIGALLVIYSLSFWGYLNWAVRVFSDIESRMTSIERLKFYSNLPQEKGHSFEAPTMSEWPRCGELSFRNVSVRYAPHLPLVLKDVSFSIPHGERVGLIGRTGSGKTTLFQTLFRFVDPEVGSISLDGKNIHEVSLPELRKNLAIIPQDPLLFIGTIRSNLDRYSQYSDEEIEAALKEASMWSHISSLALGLAAPVAENGSNFSQGQRQLLCLARALLVKAKVVVLDEATASVDVQTDLIIQKVIREKLKNATLLIIAHRLGTVADCDRIIELSQGRVQDIWKPSERRKNLSELDLKS